MFTCVFFFSVLAAGLHGFGDVKDMGGGRGNIDKVPDLLLKHPYGKGGFDRYVRNKLFYYY